MKVLQTPFIIGAPEQFVSREDDVAPERIDYRRRGLTIVQVDAFTSTPFAGNPAAVCVLSGPRDASWMQDVAREMNLSETAFLLAHDAGYRLRWFPPAAEVALCGHATLASAHDLWEDGHLAAGAPARFHTQSGLLTAEQRGDWIELDFPATRAVPGPLPAGLALALGVTPRWTGRSNFGYLLEVDSVATVRALEPDFAALRRVEARAASSSRAARRRRATISCHASSLRASASTRTP